ncbi:MAG TPA: pantoate--beta-alanine ligase [Candidatus Limnocylindrales bacterium]|jgi:pantoate--beta-alanine ligase|nr:pantoate--beta-alanine ligase [Candidatus Limnocylindrales bacterium]
MRVLRTRAELRAALADAPRPVGLVTTMGWLHEGHRELMRTARAENATTVVTIFVNPRQFNEASDYTQYPRNEAQDLAISESESVDLVFAPDVPEIYPEGFDTTVSVGAVARPLEGAARPGHFDGVATVVAILFGLVGADRAYFGQKDAQQVMVIRQMARDLAVGTEVVTLPTVREPDGLAMSSRNVHLSPEQRAAATVLRRALVAARDAWAGGERSAEALRTTMRRVLAGEPLADVEYVSVADGRTLAELDTIDGPALASMAVRFGSTRLIDNEPLGDVPGTQPGPQVYGG